MNWADFNARHEDCDQALEALGRHLFSKWCNHTFGDQVTNIVYTGGKGGDGGVEGFARLNDGTIIGLQAKWFRETFGNKQIEQLHSSIKSARQRHPTLTKYIVCMPIELQASRGRGNRGKSQTDLWEDFIDTYSDIEFAFWGDNKIEEIALEVGMPDLLAYWFGGNFISQADWHSIYERKRPWFEARYIPDLHMQGEFDDLLEMYLLTAEVRNKFIKQIGYHQQKVERCIVELERLPTLYNWESVQADNKAALRDVLKSAQKGVLLLNELRLGLTTDCELNIMGVSEWLDEFHSEARNAIGIIENARTDIAGLTPMYHCQQHLKEVAELEDVNITWEFQSLISVGSPLAMIGDAGSGKTHSVLDVAKVRLENGFPALVIPAKAIDPSTPSSEWLPSFIDKRNWTLQDCFQAMEVGTFYSPQSIGDSENEIPSRFLLVIDGLEESSRNSHWKKALAEWEFLLQSFPHIQLVCTTRPTVANDVIPDSTFTREYVTQEQNVPLHKLFTEYCRAYHINCSGVSWIKWALRSPREIRLFAEVYRGQTLPENAELAISVSSLIREVIRQVEDSLKADEKYGWDSEKSLLLPGLQNYSKAVVEKGAPAIEHDDLLNALRASCAGLGEMNASQLSHIVKGLVSGGLLDKRIRSTKNALNQEQIYYYPANQSVIDFLTAFSAMELRVKNEQGKFIVPDLFIGRFEPLAIFLQMINEVEGSYINDIYYSDVLSGEWIENAQLIALSRSVREVPVEVGQWVDELLLQTKETNRRVLNSLILPAARNPRHWCGAKYLHNKFMGMSVAERDLLWSGPDYLRRNCGGKWEGYADFRLDQIELYPNDRAIGMPLLMAWSCSSVVAKRVRYARTKLALWGAANPLEMTTLLTEFTKCNDYQVLESVLTAAAGAACYADDMEGLRELATQCYRMFFCESPLCSSRNTVCRHASRIVIERAHAFRLIPSDVIQSARPPYVPSQNLPPYMELPTDWSRNPIWGDLEWYVVKNASRLFFETVRVDCGNQEEEKRYPKTAVVKAVVEGRIQFRDDATRKIGELWEEMEAERVERETKWKIIIGKYTDDFESASTSVEEEDANQDVAGAIVPENFKEVHHIPERIYSPEAVALLKEYENKYDIKNLTPDQLRNGLILAFVYSQGWDADIFVGKPNGGKEGEVLGADISITREHSTATHGARSPIASFGEKYVWLGVNEIAGNFADRLPIKDICDSTFEPVKCYSDVGEEMPDPFDGLIDSERVSCGLMETKFPPDFWKTYESSGISQLEKSTDWVNNANWPDIAKVVVSENQLRICSWIHGVEPANAVSQMARITCLLLPKEQFAIFERDAKAGAIICRDHGGDVNCAGIDGACYQSPSIVCWAPWTKTIEDTSESYDSLNEDGDLFPIDLRYLSAKTYWSHGGNETMLYFPSPYYAPSLGVVRGDGSKDFRQFTDHSGFPVATFERLDFGVAATVEHLLIDRDRLDALLNMEKAVAVWFAEVYREVRPEFIQEAERRDVWARRRMLFICTKEAGMEVSLLSSVEIDER